MFAAILVLASPMFQAGQEAGNPPPPGQDLPAPVEDSWDLELLPSKIIYAPYLADPRQSHTSTKVQVPVDPDRGNLKIESVLGSTRPLALWTNPNDPLEEAELFLEAAVFSRFDLSEDWDMDGSDYRFGFPFAYRYGDVAMKFHLWHLTSHLGDEYMTRNPEAKRASYHNDEVCVGLSWQIDPYWRAYGELGYGLYTGTAAEKGRAQFGIEWVGEAWTGKTTPWAAADISTRKEIDWGWNLSLQAGIMFRSGSGNGGLRFLVEYYRGHDQQTQFKAEKEHYFAFGAATNF